MVALLKRNPFFLSRLLRVALQFPIRFALYEHNSDFLQPFLIPLSEGHTENRRLHLGRNWDTALPCEGPLVHTMRSMIDVVV